MQLPHDSSCKHYHIEPDVNEVVNKFGKTEAEDEIQILLTSAKPIRVYD